MPTNIVKDTQGAGSRRLLDLAAAHRLEGQTEVEAADADRALEIVMMEAQAPMKNFRKNSELQNTHCKKK